MEFTSSEIVKKYSVHFIVILLVTATLLIMGIAFFQEYDLQDEEERPEIELTFTGAYGSSYKSVVYRDGYLYTSNTYGLYIFNASNLSEPELVGFLFVNGTGHPIQELIVTEEFVFLGTDENGIIIVNITDKQDPKVQGTYDGTSHIESMALYGHFLYVTIGNQNVHIINVSNESHPIFAGTFDGGSTLSKIVYAEGFLFIIAGRDLQIHTIDDPLNPLEISTVTPNHYRIEDVFMHQRTMYILCDNPNVANTALVIMDMTDENNLEELSDTIVSWNGAIFAVDAEKKIAYIANDRLEVIDISNRTDPRSILTLSELVNPSDIAISSEAVFISDEWSRIVIIDASNDTNIFETGVVGGWNIVKDIDYHDDLVFISDNGLQIFDISDPRMITREGIVESDSPSYHLELGGEIAQNYAYVSNESGILILNIEDKENPFVEGEFKIFSHRGPNGKITIQGDLAYVIDSYFGLVICNITDPLNPTIIGGYNESGNIVDQCISGDNIYLVDKTNGLLIINISDPTNPVKEGHYSTTKLTSVAIRNDHAFAVNDTSGNITIIDITDKGNPVVISEYEMNNPRRIVINGDHAYISSYQGLHVLDISREATPVEVASYRGPGTWFDMEIHDDLVFLFGNINGFVVLQIHENSSSK